MSEIDVERMADRLDAIIDSRIAHQTKILAVLLSVRVAIVAVLAFWAGSQA